MWMLSRDRLLVLDPDPRVLYGVRAALGDHFHIETATNIKTAMVLLSHRHYDAIVCDWEESFGDSALGFRGLLRHCWPRMRCLTLSDQVAPHLATLLKYRAMVRWNPRPVPHRGALLNALAVSADDPQIRSPYAN